MKKSEYTRITTECRYEDFKAVFIQSIKDYANEYKLGDLESEVLACFETTNSKKGFLGGTKITYTDICLTKRFLIWNTMKNDNDKGVGAARWTDIIEIWDWEETESNKIMPDCGLEIFGSLMMSSHRSRWFMAMTNEGPGYDCRKLIRENSPNIPKK